MNNGLTFILIAQVDKLISFTTTDNHPALHARCNGLNLPKNIPESKEIEVKYGFKNTN